MAMEFRISILVCFNQIYIKETLASTQISTFKTFQENLLQNAPLCPTRMEEKRVV